jgi:peptidoglycan/xylan/chitin deacetylase (PgdA/CDA1 family)
MKPEPTKLTRKDFLKISGYTALGLGLEALLSGCHLQTMIPQQSILPPVPERAEPTFIPTRADAPSQFSAPHLYHDPTTREVLRRGLINKYGPAEKVLSLEFHGDYYYLEDGSYNMDPDTFAWLMEWFHHNEVWAVNGRELLGFLDGALELPARSVVLTTDSGNTSIASLTRMIPVLQRTGMHFISLIFTAKMDAGESVTCEGDACWEKFREAVDSGVFSIGSHSDRHPDFQELSAREGLRDLLRSKAAIEDNLGIEVELLSWPYESCPVWMDQLPDHGFKAAFGGRSRPIEDCSIYPLDELRWCLPRLLPPNRDTLTSNRPLGMTIDQMMLAYSGGFEE